MSTTFNPTTAAYVVPFGDIIRPGERAELARFTRDALTERRHLERIRTRRQFPGAPFSSCGRLDDLAEDIDGWIGANETALAMLPGRMHTPPALAADQLRRLNHLDAAADRVIARATSDLDERTYQHQRAYGRAAAAERYRRTTNLLDAYATADYR